MKDVFSQGDINLRQTKAQIVITAGRIHPDKHHRRHRELDSQRVTARKLLKLRVLDWVGQGWTNHDHIQSD